MKRKLPLKTNFTLALSAVMVGEFGCSAPGTMPTSSKVPS